MIALTLPLPPTINTYYGMRPRGGRFVKPAGLAFRKAVSEIVAAAGHPTLNGRVSLFVAIHPADRRSQDLDNRAKSLQDALTHAGVWLDDEQIDDLHLVRKEVVKGGMVRVVITELKEAP
jgi:crossover junction endodeoxyribonuclease RusA